MTEKKDESVNIEKKSKYTFSGSRKKKTIINKPILQKNTNQINEVSQQLPPKIIINKVGQSIKTPIIEGDSVNRHISEEDDMTILDSQIPIKWLIIL